MLAEGFVITAVAASGGEGGGEDGDADRAE